METSAPLPNPTAAELLDTANRYRQLAVVATTREEREALLVLAWQHEKQAIEESKKAAAVPGSGSA